ncbi:MAG: amidase, partial [Pseudomonadota bacterium]
MSAPAVPALTSDELKHACEVLNFDMSDEELGIYGALAASLVDGANLIDSLDEPRLPVKYPRDAGYRPTGKENEFNAWYRKVNIEGATSGKL